MILKKIFLLIAVTAFLKSTAQDITITEVVWTDSVEGSIATNNYRDSIPIGQVGIWIKAQCSASVLENIRSRGSLPIKYQWYKRAGAGWTPKGVDDPNDKTSADQHSILDSLIVANKDFYWNSWCLRRRSQMSRGVWKIMVRTPDNTLLEEVEIVVTRDHE
jgi:hypothetical protein